MSNFSAVALRNRVNYLVRQPEIGIPLTILFALGIAISRASASETIHATKPGNEITWREARTLAAKPGTLVVKCEKKTPSESGRLRKVKNSKASWHKEVGVGIDDAFSAANSNAVYVCNEMQAGERGTFVRAE